MMEDESTDDELGVNLQLGERLQINRQPHCSYHNTRSRARNSKEHKEYWNGRKKDMCSSSCSTAVNPQCSESATVNGWFVPDTPSPYHLGNKKRQNRDKHVEQIAKSKRTCFNVCPNMKEGKIKNRCCKDSSHCANIPTDCSNFPETAVKSEPSTSSSCNVASDFLDRRSDSCLDLLHKNLSPDEKYRDFMENGPSFSEIDGTNSSSSNFSSTDLLHGVNGSRNGNSSKPYDASLSFPSTSSSGQSYTDTFQSNVARTAHNIPLGVQFIDSESDESNRVYVEHGALKGGKQLESNHFQNKVVPGTRILESDASDNEESIRFHNKVIGRHMRRAIESDDDDDNGDSDNSWQPAFRKHLRRVLLSESEESVEEQSESLLSRTHCCGDSKKKNCSSHFNSCKKTPYIPLPCDKSDGESDNFASGHCKKHQGSAARKSPKKGSRTRRESHPKASNKHVPLCDYCSHGSSSQSRAHSCSKHHRSGSPHPRSLRQRKHSREPARSAAGRMNNLTSGKTNLSSGKTGMCKKLDDEDSSDVEFFSANSNSESGPGEALRCFDIRATARARCRARSEGTRAFERAISDPESSEDEVSIVFTADPPFREINNSRHRRHRGTARRRHSRVSSRGTRSQDSISVSPDPVEQVRQMEEDERLARFLQAQFDAEVVPEECAPEISHFHNIVDSDNDEEIDPVGNVSDDGWIFEEVMQSENASSDHHHHHHGFSHSPTFLSAALHRARARGRPRMTFSFSTVNNSSGRGRHSRRRYIHGGTSGDPWMWQFARMMGQTVNRGFDSDGADYEALWDLAEDVGEVVPRGLSKSEINRLPTRKYFNTSGGDAASGKDCDETTHKRTELNKECQVCLCDYETGDVLRILPCFHEFHTACIDPWLKINHTCPVCRVEVDLEDN